jgi:hypothetical protein
MPFTKTIYTPSLQNPVTDAISGGRMPAGNVIVNVSGWADAQERQNTPFLSSVKMGPEVHALKNEWGQSFLTPVEGILGAATTNNSADITLHDITGTSGGSKLVTPWMVLQITPWLDTDQTRLDTENAEEVIVRSIGGSDVVTVIRDNNATSSGSWPVHADNSHWKIIGVAAPYNRDFVMSPYTRGSRIYNHPQRFMGMIGADVAAQNTPDYEFSGNRMVDDFKKETLRQKYFLNQALLEGQLLEGNNFDVPAGSDTTVIPYKMDGIDSLITKHSGRVTNSGQERLSVWDIEALMRDQFKDLVDGGAKTIMAGVDTSSVFDGLLNPFKSQAGLNDTTATMMTDSIKLRWGTISFEMQHHLNEGKLLFVDKSDCSVHAYKGCSWSTKIVQTAGPYDKKAIWGDYTFKANRLQRMAKIWNFTVDLDSYGRRAFFF